MLFGLFTFLPFTACLFWTAVLLLDWRRDNAAQHLLAAFIGTSAMLYLCHAAFFNHEPSLMAISECIYAFCNISVFPLYYLYICRLTDRHGLSLKHLIMLLPAIVIGLWATILNIFRPEDIAAENLRIMVMRIVFMVQLLPICWICYRKLKVFDNEIANYYADTEKRSVRPTVRMMWLLVVGGLISGMANLLGRNYFDSSELLICVPSILFTTLLFGVGYIGKRQEFCIDDLIHDEKQGADILLQLQQVESVSHEAREPENEVPDSAAETPSDIIVRLDTLMATSQLYLRPDLRLSEVATMLGVGRTTLSQRINQELQISFSDYINNLRVDYACQLLNNPESNKLSLTGIAEMSGFSSDSSFYRAFRRRTGKTPKQFK